MRPSSNCFPIRANTDLIDELRFRPSCGVTLGVELELQLLDPATRELAPGAVRVLDACADEKLPGISGEFLLCMIEAKTGVCQNVQEVRDTFVPLLRKLRNISRSLGYEVCSGGTHPCGRPLMSALYPDERYQRIQNKQGWSAYQEAVFGLHVHVGVPSANQAIRVSNLVSRYLPHLLALSANSPLWEGIDTNYASTRARMFRPGAHVGVPPQFRDWSRYSAFVNRLHRAGAIDGTKDLYWDIRPRADFGTIEFRIFDAPPTVEHLLALVALTRSLVVQALRTLERDPQRGQPSFTRAWLANENRWAASRFGLNSPHMLAGKSGGQTLRDDCARLMRRILPVARDMGEHSFLEPLLHLPSLETGAARQRRVFRDQGQWQSVVDDMCDRWSQGFAADLCADGATAVETRGCETLRIRHLAIASNALNGKPR